MSFHFIFAGDYIHDKKALYGILFYSTCYSP